MAVVLKEEVDQYCSSETNANLNLNLNLNVNLTVMKTSLFFAGDGFAAYDSNCRLAFRVDSYGGPDNRDRDEVALLDATGLCLLTLRRKRLSLHQRWEGYAEEGMEGAKPIFSVRRVSMVGRRSSVSVEMNGADYLIEGSFSNRCCTFYDVVHTSNGDGNRNGSKKKSVVAEIRRKVDLSTNVVLGKDVFVLSLKPGFAPTFAMAIVLVLDQISSGEDDDDDDHDNTDYQNINN